VSALSLTGRVTFSPINWENDRHTLHFGVSFSTRNPARGTLQYRSRPEARFVNYLVDTGDLSTSHARLWGVEFAEIRGPMWIAAEYISSRLSADDLDNPSFGGTYVQVGWFLTGESKPYRDNSGTFDRLRPRFKYHGGNPFKKKNGGAWEVVGRLSTIDLSDGSVDGGRLTDVSAALGWYLNATTKVEVNLIHAMPNHRGSANIALLRLQYNPW
jgi:phosphate-selective porin OprO/OprP